jgi:hypothetical protein
VKTRKRTSLPCAQTVIHPFISDTPARAPKLPASATQFGLAL